MKIKPTLTHHIKPWFHHDDAMRFIYIVYLYTIEIKFRLHQEIKFEQSRILAYVNPWASFYLGSNFWQTLIFDKYVFITPHCFMVKAWVDTSTRKITSLQELLQTRYRFSFFSPQAWKDGIFSILRINMMYHVSNTLALTPFQTFLQGVYKSSVFYYISLLDKRI